MALTADLLALRKLAIAKQVYLDATRQRTKPSPTARLIAVVEYDMAIETVLKTTLVALNAKKVPASDFPGLVQQVAAAMTTELSTELPRAAAIQHVRNTRNAAQHEGRLPTSAEEDECHVIARGFLEDLLTLVWDLSFDAVSLVELIADASSTERLTEGQAALGARDHRAAVEKAGEALEWALMRVKNALVGRSDAWARAILTEDSFGKPKASRELATSIQRTQETVLYIALGLDYGDLVRFRVIAGSTSFYIGGGAGHYGIKDELDVSDAEFALAYASEAIVQIEARVGSIDKPFGRDHWF